MVGLIKPVPRALVPGYCKSPVGYVIRKGYRIQLQFYQGDAYAYSVEGDKPAESFYAIRNDIYSAVEHEMVVEIALELLEQ